MSIRASRKFTSEVSLNVPIGTDKDGKEIRSDQKFCGNCGTKNVNYQEKNDLKEMIEKAAAGEENALEKIYNLTYV